jgi:hypothetical protein
MSTLEECQTVIAEQHLMIRALKKSLHITSRLDIYDTRYSQAINELAFKWIEYYICRHFLNHSCRHSSSSCMRIHRFVSGKVLMSEFYKIEVSNNIYASLFVNKLIRDAANGNWKSSNQIREIISELKSLLIQ